MMLKLWVYTCVHESNNVIMGNEKQIICSGKVFQAYSVKFLTEYAWNTSYGG